MEPQTVNTQLQDQLLRSIARQLRGIKVMLAVFFIFLLLMLATLGFVAYKVITFTRQINTKISNIETKASQSLDVKSQLCDNSSLGGLLNNRSNICK